MSPNHFSFGFNSTVIFLQHAWLSYWITFEGWCDIKQRKSCYLSIYLSIYLSNVMSISIHSLSNGLNSTTTVQWAWNGWAEWSTGNYARNWCRHSPARLFENETHKILWDFDIQTDHLISARRSDLILINKKRKLAKLWTLLFRRTSE